MHAVNAPDAPTRVAILAFAETTASVLYGMHDFFAAAGRDWESSSTACRGRR